MRATTSHLDAPTLGVDIGGTKTAAALVLADGTVVGRKEVRTPSNEGAGAVLDAIAAVVEQVRMCTSSYGEPAALGLGAAGVVDPDTGVVVGATDSIGGWRGTPLTEELHLRTGLVVRAVNDVVAFLLGEQTYGAAAGAQHVVAVSVGTGVGGALLLDGRVIRGHRNVAGHVGHLLSPQAGELPCGCGAAGHVEAIASGPSMAADYSRRSGMDVSDFREVAGLADAGDATARAIVSGAARALGATLGGLVNAVAPQVVLLGGGVVSGSPAYVEGFTAALQSTLVPALDDVRVHVGALGGDAAIVGAGVLARADCPVPTQHSGRVNA